MMTMTAEGWAITITWYGGLTVIFLVPFSWMVRNTFHAYKANKPPEMPYPKYTDDEEIR
jgi:hypothetical protein